MRRWITFAIASALVALLWPQVIERLPFLLPPGFALADMIQPLAADPGEAEIARYQERVILISLGFWWLAAAIVFLILEPGRVRRLREVLRDAGARRAEDEPLVQAAARLGEEGRKLAVKAAPAVASVDAAVRGAARLAAPVVKPALAAGAGAGGFLAWLLQQVVGLLGHALLAALMALLVAGALVKSPFLTTLVLLLVAPTWVVNLFALRWPSWFNALLLGVTALLTMFLGGFEALVRLGTVSRYNSWSGVWRDIDVRTDAFVIWFVVMLAILFRHWLRYRQERDARAARTIVADARRRVTAARAAADEAESPEARGSSEEPL